jgi:tRNA nucleotidyltransferase (CCA-adding enzyme)
MILPLTDIPELWKARFDCLGEPTSPKVSAVVLVGGCVRDMLLGRAPFDWDIMVEGEIGPVLAEAERRLSPTKIIRHQAFMTAVVHFPDGTSLDVVTARTEHYPHPAALPVVAPASLADDFRRRDFTVNAMAARLDSRRLGELLDPFNGRGDMEKKILRVLHDRSFIDDPTRIYRAARYAGRYGWAVDPGTAALIETSVREGGPELLSPARRRNELTHLLREPDAAPAMDLLWRWGMWRFWSAEWQWTSAVATALSTPSDDPLPERLAALCADLTPQRRDDVLRDLQFPSALRTALSGRSNPV